MIGIMIAKVTSYRVDRIYSSDAQKRLENFAEGFNKSQRDFAEIMTNVEATRFAEIVRTFQAQCIAFSRYFSDETNRGDYFRIVPASTITQVGNVVDSVFSELKRIADSLQAMAEVYSSLILEAIDAQRKVCQLVAQYADEDTRGVFQGIEDTCTQLEDYFVPQKELEPDQSPQGPDEPQQSPGVDDE